MNKDEALAAFRRSDAGVLSDDCQMQPCPNGWVFLPSADVGASNFYLVSKEEGDLS